MPKISGQTQRSIGRARQRRPKRQKMQIEHHPHTYDYSKYDVDLRLARPMRILMFGCHWTLLANERLTFERLGHKTYSMLDVWEGRTGLEITKGEMQLLRKFLPHKKAPIDVSQREVYDIIRRRFDVIYVTQLADWLNAFRPVIDMPIILRIYGHTKVPLVKAIKRFMKKPNFHIVSVSHTEKETVPHRCRPIMASVERILEEAKEYSRVEKDGSYLTVLSGATIKNARDDYTIINCSNKAISREALNELFARCSVYVYFFGKRHILKYTPLEAIAHGALVVTKPHNTLGEMFRIGGVRDLLSDCYYSGGISDALDLADTLMLNPGRMDDLISIQHGWLLNEVKRCRYEWNQVFRSIENNA
jgi:hypothetical protein